MNRCAKSSGCSSAHSKTVPRARRGDSDGHAKSARSSPDPSIAVIAVLVIVMRMQRTSCFVVQMVSSVVAARPLAASHQVALQETDEAILASVLIPDDADAGHASLAELAEASQEYERRLERVRGEAEHLREAVAPLLRGRAESSLARLVVRLLDEFDRHGRIKVKVDSVGASHNNAEEQELAGLQGKGGGDAAASGGSAAPLPVWFVPLLATGTSLACFVGCVSGIVVTKTWWLRRNVRSDGPAAQRFPDPTRLHRQGFARTPQRRRSTTPQDSLEFAAPLS